MIFLAAARSLEHASNMCLPFFLCEIEWENRKLDSEHHIVHVTNDGTDQKINEPQPFSRSWYSHKLKHAGHRFEIAVSIGKGWIVWVNGPYPCGRFNDITIARDGVVGMLDDGEMVLADSGYRDGRVHFITPSGHNNYSSYMQTVIRARHETVNSRMRIFKSISECWRHDRSKHGITFHAVAIITQLTIMHESPLFHVDYDEQQLGILDNRGA